MMYSIVFRRSHFTIVQIENHVYKCKIIVESFVVTFRACFSVAVAVVVVSVCFCRK